MGLRKYVVAVVLFVVAVAAALAVVQVAGSAADSANHVADNVTNESINQQVDLWQFVNKATEETTTGFNDTVTVYNASGAELVRGTDYQWNATDGSIKYLNTANVTDGATGDISYVYFRETQDVQGLSAVIDPVVAFVSRSGLLVGGLALVVALLAFAAVVGRYIGNDSGRQYRR